jgi:hypothetical protein
MRIHWSAACAAIGVLVGAVACAGNTAKTDEQQTGAAATATDTTRDTTSQNPSGYRGMERDTSMVPAQQPTPTDTFLQNQGTGQPQDTAGYSGIERVDTTGMQPDSTTGGMQHDSTTGGMQHDSTMGGQDTTGYDRAQTQDSTSR